MLELNFVCDLFASLHMIFCEHSSDVYTPFSPYAMLQFAIGVYLFRLHDVPDEVLGVLFTVAGATHVQFIIVPTRTRRMPCIGLTAY